MSRWILKCQGKNGHCSVFIHFDKTSLLDLNMRFDCNHQKKFLLIMIITMGQGPSAKSKVPNKYFTRTECRNILAYCISRANGFAGEGPRLAYFFLVLPGG